MTSETMHGNVMEFLRSIRIAMPRLRMPRLSIGDISVRLPVIQGGMGVGISLSGLASAVAEAGGIGVIAANGIGMIENDYFKDGRAANIRALVNEIRAARRRTKGIIGVNIMVAVNDFNEQLLAAVEERVDLLILGAGLPVKNIPVDKIRANNVKVVPIVSSARAAELIFKMWKRIYGDVPDAVVLEGPLAGGHLGFSEAELDDPSVSLERILPQVVEALKPYEAEFGRRIPVIAAGGIYDGADILAAMKGGAAGVQMATRFVATDECDADVKFKEAYLACTRSDIGIIQSPVGMPGRAIVNDFLTEAAAGRGRSFTCPWQCLASCRAEKAQYCISVALNNARRGRLDHGFVFVGANAWRVDEIVPVAALMKELEVGYVTAAVAEAMERLRGLIDTYKHLEAMAARLRERLQREIGLAALKEEYGRARRRLVELRAQMRAAVAEFCSAPQAV